MKFKLIRLVVILAYLRGLPAQQCLYAESGTSTSPPSEDQQNAVSLPAGSQAIIETYKFRCCRVIKEWTVFFTPRHKDIEYNISLQVWRPTISSSQCYTLVGENEFPFTVVKNHKIQPSVRQRDKITAQRGDVLGYRVTRLGGNGQGGIQLKPPDGNSYTSDMVWYTQPSPNGIQEYRILRTGCSYCIGEGRSLPTQSVAAPVLIASLDGPSNCDSPSLQSTITPACAATGAETSINPTKALTSLAVPNSQGVSNTAALIVTTPSTTHITTEYSENPSTSMDFMSLHGNVEETNIWTTAEAALDEDNTLSLTIIAIIGALSAFVILLLGGGLVGSILILTSVVRKKQLSHKESGSTAEIDYELPELLTRLPSNTSEQILSLPYAMNCNKAYRTTLKNNDTAVTSDGSDVTIQLEANSRAYGIMKGEPESVSATKKESCDTSRGSRENRDKFRAIIDGEKSVSMKKNEAYRALTGREKSIDMKKNEAYRALTGREETLKMKKNEAYRALTGREETLKMKKNEAYRALTGREETLKMKKNEAYRALTGREKLGARRKNEAYRALTGREKLGARRKNEAGLSNSTVERRDNTSATLKENEDAK